MFRPRAICYRDKSGRVLTVYDRSNLFPKFCDNLKYFLSKFLSYIKCCLPIRKVNKQGKFVWRNGIWVHIDNSAKIPDIWFRRHKINGYRDSYAGYKSLEQRGLLSKVNDRECYNQLLKQKYLFEGKKKNTSYRG